MSRTLPLPFPAPTDTLRLARTLQADDPLRLRLEAACERLEALTTEILEKLDDLTGDPDLEPYLAGLNCVNTLDVEANDDREADCDIEDNGDGEPWLAGFARQVTPGWMRREAPGQYVRVMPDAEDDGGDDLGADTDTEEVSEGEGADDEREHTCVNTPHVPDWPPTNTTMRGGWDGE